MATRAVRKNEPPIADDVAPNVLLIGLRGSGKSTIGPMLAETLKHQFIDLDVVTLWRLRCGTVTEAWSEYGVPRFRAAEVEGMTAALDNPERVIAAGGGTPTAPGAAELIRTHQEREDLLVVYLRGTPTQLRERLSAVSNDANRPSLTGAGTIDEVDDVFGDRDPLYRDLADMTLDMTEPLDLLIESIIERLRAGGARIGGSD